MRELCIGFSGICNVAITCTDCVGLACFVRNLPTLIVHTDTVRDTDTSVTWQHIYVVTHIPVQYIVL
jgi:hypothetical protein